LGKELSGAVEEWKPPTLGGAVFGAWKRGLFDGHVGVTAVESGLQWAVTEKNPPIVRYAPAGPLVRRR